MVKAKKVQHSVMNETDDTDTGYSLCVHGNHVRYRPGAPDGAKAGGRKLPGLSLSDGQIRKADALLTRREREIRRIRGVGMISEIDVCPLSIYAELGYVRPADVRFDPAYTARYERWMVAHAKAYGPAQTPPEKVGGESGPDYIPTAEDLRILAGNF